MPFSYRVFLTLPEKRHNIPRMPGNPNPRTDHLVATQFQPGNSGGPGRPRKRPMSEAADDRVRTPLEPKFRNKFAEMGITVAHDATVADGIIYALSLKALAGDVAAAKELREQIEGKSKIRVEVEDNTKRTPRLVVVFEGKPTDPQQTRQLLDEKGRSVIDVERINAAQAVQDAIIESIVEEESEDAQT